MKGLRSVGAYIGYCKFDIFLSVHSLTHMCGIFTYIWINFMVNVGQYTIHGTYGLYLITILHNLAHVVGDHVSILICCGLEHLSSYLTWEQNFSGVNVTRWALDPVTENTWVPGSSL